MKTAIKNLSIGGLWLLLVGVCSVAAYAQIGEMGYNPNSVRGEQRVVYGQPIYEDDIMYRTTVWRKINLQEKQNLPFFAMNNEITRVIIDAVQAGELKPYFYSIDPRSDGVSQEMELDKFNDKFSYYNEDIGENVAVRPRDLFMLEMKEDLLFDRRRSRMYWDIQTITIIIPAGVTGQPFETQLASFKFKDLYAFFDKKYKESLVKGDDKAKGGTIEAVRAFWYNPQNPKRHMSLADAFELRLFSSRISKVSNPKDQSIVEIINDEYAGNQNIDQALKVLYMSQKIEYDLMEYEHNLWEF